MKGWQRTPELESSMVTTSVWQVDSNSRYHTTRVLVAAAATE